MVPEHLLFVYGTIRAVNKKDHPLEEHVAERIMAAEAYLSGFKMLHLGDFPGLIEGGKEDIVRGEIHRIESPDCYDGYEGYHPDLPIEKSLYTRRQVSIHIPDGPDPSNPEQWNDYQPVKGVWVYVFNAEHQMHHFADEHAPVIESGDWFEEEDLYAVDTDTSV